MFEFARNGHQVFYCNKRQLTEPCLEKAAENLNVVHNLDKFKEKYLPAVKATGAPVIVWCSWALLANTLKDLQPDMIIYDCLDEFAEWLPYEPAMVGMADIVFCSSDYLIGRIASQYPGKKVYLLNNACDFKWFSTDTGTVPKPVDLPETAGARIGYIGAWAWWVDTELVQKVCTAFPRHQVVVIGPNLGQQIPRQYPNFVYLGLKSYEELPGYLAFLDVCIIPFRINETTMATNPIKVYEYLAAGKKVVSTALPEVEKMQPLVRVGASHEEFLAHIGASLETAHENLDQVRVFAEENSWERRYLQLEQILSVEISGFHNPVTFDNEPSNFDTEPGNFDTEAGNVEELSSVEDSTTVCLHPVADLTISSSRPTTNLNCFPFLIGRINQVINRFLLKFDTTGISGQINRAVLNLFVEKCDLPDKQKCIEVRRINSSWDEELTTWQTRPKTGPVPVAAIHFHETGGWLEWDITPLAAEWVANPATNLGVEIKGSKDTLPFLVRGVNRHGNNSFSPILNIYLNNG
jgi:glycosyltransferase involved in cell wall biosynthesis